MTHTKEWLLLWNHCYSLWLLSTRELNDQANESVKFDCDSVCDTETVCQTLFASFLMPCPPPPLFFNLKIRKEIHQWRRLIYGLWYSISTVSSKRKPELWNNKDNKGSVNIRSCLKCPKGKTEKKKKVFYPESEKVLLSSVLGNKHLNGKGVI